MPTAPFAPPGVNNVLEGFWAAGRAGKRSAEFEFD
jgi:hypothetical protein